MKQRPIVDHIEQPHDLADPAADDGQRRTERAGARPRSSWRNVNAIAVNTT